VFERQGQRLGSPGTKTAFSALSAACVQFVFGKNILAYSLKNFLSRFDVSNAFSLILPSSFIFYERCERRMRTFKFQRGTLSTNDNGIILGLFFLLL